MPVLIGVLAYLLIGALSGGAWLAYQDSVGKFDDVETPMLMFAFVFVWPVTIAGFVGYYGFKHRQKVLRAMR